ncbi:dihydrofolate reductase family protein [Microcella sp.]|uniref:dihydrofolate reductase family protein n=1 Tax=Microcella sp. TaxID=1913979 RepID=UPI003F6E451D
MTTTRTWRGCVFIGVSLDGFIARTDGELSWLTDPEPRAHPIGAHIATVDPPAPALVWETFYPAIDTLLIGRHTYESVLAFDPWPFDGKAVIVLSSGLVTDDERVVVARSLDEARSILTRTGARRVYIDGGRTIQAFLAAGLVDELTVSIAPVLIGSGRRLFGDLDRDVLLSLRGTHATADDGLVRLTYDVVRPGS